MLTTTVDGLWVLQVLSGIEVLAPELGLRPHLPSAESRCAALSHPAAGDLRKAGVITADGEVDPTVSEWLTVVSRRDLALLLHAQTPQADGADRVVLARLAHWWVALERFGPMVRLVGVGVAATEAEAGLLIGAQIDRLCGELQPADIPPIAIEVDRLMAYARGEADPRRGLPAAGRLDPCQVRLLTAAADPRSSAQASIVALQARDRPQVAAGTVTIIDTPHGRLLSEQVKRDARVWMLVGPGSGTAIRHAVRELLRQTSAHAQWYCHRKVYP